MSTATANSWTRSTTAPTADYEMPKPDQYPCRLIGLIDLGTQDNTYQGKTKKRHKLLLIWELPGEIDSKGHTFTIQADYTFTLAGDKSHLRSLIEAWEGRSLPDGVDYDFMGLMGREGLINLTEGVSGNNKKFLEIASIGKLPKGMLCPKGQKEPFAWNFALVGSSHDEIDIPAWVLPLYGKVVKDEIKKSDEWKSLPNF